MNALIIEEDIISAEDIINYDMDSSQYDVNEEKEKVQEHDVDEDIRYEEENEENELDISWIKQFEEEDSKYTDFYAENVHFVHLRIIYINKNSEIIKVKQEQFHLLNPNYISRDELLFIIKNNCAHDAKKYDILSIAKFNIDLSPLDLKSFIKSKDDLLGEIYLTPLSHVYPVTLEKTITMLQDLNELLIVFYDVKPTIKPNMSVTKRIRFTPSRNKTIKNNLKT